MLRRTILAILLVSLLFCTLATIASLFHVAYSQAEYTARPGGPSRGTSLTLILRSGALQAWNSGSYYDPGWSVNPGGTSDLQWWPPESRFFESYTLASGFQSWKLHLPLWIPLAAISTLAIIPLWLEGRHQRRARRHRRGLCTHCGYNLAGLAQPACPECGAPGATSPPQSGATGDATPTPNPR